MNSQDTKYTPIPLPDFVERPQTEMLARAEAFYEQIRRRHTVRDFSPRPVPREIIEHCLRAAGTAPSGANHQPWHFAVIADAARKRRIREAAEEEERAFYSGRAGKEWLEALEPLGTDADKSFLETAPWLICIFGSRRSVGAGGKSRKNYYVPESVGIATGFLIAALHEAGLATLTHTPNPMGFLAEILRRPANERAYVVIPVGYPAENAQVPVISKKSLDEIMVRFD